MRRYGQRGAKCVCLVCYGYLTEDCCAKRGSIEQHRMRRGRIHMYI